jgi:hypothetical protein
VHKRFARKKRAGILPNRDAGSKRKLREVYAQTPQNVHSFSTDDFLIASWKNLVTSLFQEFTCEKYLSPRRFVCRGTLFVGTHEFRLA